MASLKQMNSRNPVTYLEYVSPFVTSKCQEDAIYRDLSSEIVLITHFVIF
jgi:hypothetical protein